jgi:hypothetical protein
MQQTHRKAEVDRRHFIGGSDARIIMGEDEKALIRLWQEKRGEVGPEDLSANLIVQLGVVTEDLNRVWYERSLAGFSRGRGARGNPSETYSRRVTIGKFNAQTLKSFANLISSRSEPSDRVGAAGFHIPNRVVANSDLFGQSLLVEPQQCPSRPQLVS